jgi:4,5-dihydroxyphthalate decarboxylase
METLRLTVAMHDYDHTLDLVSGAVQPQGITLVPLNVRPHEAFYRFMTHGEWEISEMSMGGYCSSVADGTANCTAIPVFPSRVFRQSAIFVRDDGSVTRAEDLRGRRVGVPEWGMTAVIYIRGWLMHQVGIPLADIDWVQAGMNEAGRVEKVGLNLPDGVTVEIVAEKSLSEMLVAGDIDAILCAAPPACFRQGKARRLFPDFQTVEEAYFRETGIYPIMHAIAIRRDVYDRDPWIASSLYAAFDEARRRSVARIMAHGSQIAMPWMFVCAQRMHEMMFPGGDYWPYGIEPNRVTLDAFLQYCFEQGVCQRLLTTADIFAKETRSFARE